MFKERICDKSIEAVEKTEIIYTLGYTWESKVHSLPADYNSSLFRQFDIDFERGVLPAVSEPSAAEIVGRILMEESALVLWIMQ